MRKIWSKREEEDLKILLSSKSYDELSEYFQTPKLKIIDKVHKMGLSRKLASGEYWSKEEDRLLSKHFEWAPKNTLMSLFPDRTWSSITQRGWNTLSLKRLSQDKYSIDYSFFSEWSREVAYLVGFIAADGYLMIDEGERNQTALQIELAEQDSDILYKMKKILKFEGPVSISNRSTVKIAISNRKVCYDLMSKGIPSSNKTIALVWPKQLPEEFERDFMRGLLDGDGSVFFDKDRISCQFLGTKNIIENIKNKLPLDLSRNSIQDRNKYGGADIYAFKVTGKKARVILDYLYEDASIYLDRKYNIALNLDDKIV